MFGLRSRTRAKHVGGRRVRLLFDQNLSPRLPKLLADLFPNSEHVDAVGMGASDDSQVWDYALKNGLSIVTKDEDYSQMSVFRGSPPKIIWLLIGNCTTGQVEALIRMRYADIMAFEQDASVGVLAIG